MLSRPGVRLGAPCGRVRVGGAALTTRHTHLPRRGAAYGTTTWRWRWQGRGRRGPSCPPHRAAAGPPPTARSLPGDPLVNEGLADHTRELRFPRPHAAPSPCALCCGSLVPRAGPPPAGAHGCHRGVGIPLRAPPPGWPEHTWPSRAPCWDLARRLPEAPPWGKGAVRARGAEVPVLRVPRVPGGGVPCWPNTLASGLRTPTSGGTSRRPRRQGGDLHSALSAVARCPAPGTRAAGPATCPRCPEPTPACVSPAFLQASQGGGVARAAEGGRGGRAGRASTGCEGDVSVGAASKATAHQKQHVAVNRTLSQGGRDGSIDRRRRCDGLS